MADFDRILDWWERGGPYDTPAQAETTVQAYESALLADDADRLARIERLMRAEYDAAHTRDSER